MKTTTQILPGIKFIGWLDCRNLPCMVALSAICRIPVPIFTDVNPIDFFGNPECQRQTKKEGGGYEETASLKFLSDTELPATSFLGFVITDANGISYLIGSREPPHPIVEMTRRTGTPSSDNAGILYDIKHVALRTLMQCII
ncbi:MAG: hypothetical protein K2G90_09370 [Muribaculaceae bacterium]|nr:hypothetical protein [Muribaculaceae bacterium]